MIAVLRFDAEEESLLAELEELLELLAVRPGFVRGRVGRAADDPTAWVLLTEWSGAGTYRRALSSYEMKVRAPLLGRARPEASAFEVLAARDEQAGS